eukprot:g5753.t1 g5753   contig20:90111-92393(+)
MSSTIVTPTHTDVLFGRGVATNRHPGNENFRTIVKDYVGVYVTSTKKQKMLTSRSIVDLIQTQLSPPGRFLEKDVKTGLWRVVDRKKAVEKTAQTLRDGAAPLRKELTHHNNNARERRPPKSSSTEKTKATSYSTTKETPTVALGLTAATNFTNNADGAGDDDGDSSPYILDRRILLNDGGSTFRSSVAQRNDGGSNNILEMFSQESDKSISSSPGAKAEQSIASSGSCSQEEQSVQQSRSDVSKKEDEQNDCSNNDEDSDEEESISSSQHRLNQAEQANNMIFITLECGLASICRLRHLYPSNFFTKMEHEGTSVTKFNVDALRKICNGGDDKQKRLVEGGDVDEGEDGLGEEGDPLSRSTTITIQTHYLP